MAVYTKTLIGNMALSHCGISTLMSDIDTDDTNEAIQCRLWYDTCRDALLEMLPWSFAEIETPLSLIEEEPNDRWAYSYLYPNFVKRINFIVNPYVRQPSPTSPKIPYKIQNYEDGPGKIILTDQEDAIINANRWITDESLYTDVYAMGQSLMIATYISKPLRVDAKIKLDIAKDWAAWLAEAQVQSKSEQQDDPAPDSEFASGRM